MAASPMFFDVGVQDKIGFSHFSVLRQDEKSCCVLCGGGVRIQKKTPQCTFLKTANEWSAQ